MPLSPRSSIRPVLSGLRKAAIFLAQLTSAEAATLMSKLQPTEVDALTAELMRLEIVEPADAAAVLAEFHTTMSAYGAFGAGGAEFAREVLVAGLGEEKADGILSRLNVVYTELPSPRCATATSGSWSPSSRTSTRRSSPWCWRTCPRRSRPRCSRASRRTSRPTSPTGSR
ncbi:hypothetical protein GCM10023328_46770 [Modestobacter marinus]|uniref:Flagellar motor switch protein FliG n=1 Tax=Modestobacter marinus TaxID=477641 RepID=A0ABQ2GA92_9ACTN|nr:hypothetical protein GCM10011589_44830 [Modestobacter marinus]